MESWLPVAISVWRFHTAKSLRLKRWWSLLAMKLGNQSLWQHKCWTAWCEIQGQRVPKSRMLEQLSWIGADAVMLSGETAPPENIQSKASGPMRSVVWGSGPNHGCPCRHCLKPNTLYDSMSPSDQEMDAVAASACMAAIRMDAKVIVLITTTGKVARAVSRHRPTVPILAFCTDPQSWQEIAAPSWNHFITHTHTYIQYSKTPNQTTTQRESMMHRRHHWSIHLFIHSLLKMRPSQNIMMMMMMMRTTDEEESFRWNQNDSYRSLNWLASYSYILLRDDSCYLNYSTVLWIHTYIYLYL